jgi:hypothetical protein
MKYEIPREGFKQRLEDRLNFVFVDLQPSNSSPVKFENIEHLSYGPQFKTEFATKFPNKNQNVIVFSMKKGDEAPSLAADDLSNLGYQFVYYYVGSADDVVLDKGLN